MWCTRFVFLLHLAVGEGAGEFDLRAEEGFDVDAEEGAAVLPGQDDRESDRDEVEREDLNNKHMSFVKALHDINKTSPSITDDELLRMMQTKQEHIAEMIELHKEIEELHEKIVKATDDAEDRREDVAEALYSYGRSYDDKDFERSLKQFARWKKANARVDEHTKDIAILVEQRAETRSKITDLDVKLQEQFKAAEKRAKKVLGLANSAKNKFGVLHTAVDMLPADGFPKSSKQGGHYLGIDGKGLIGGAKPADRPSDPSTQRSQQQAISEVKTASGRSSTSRSSGRSSRSTSYDRQKSKDLQDD